MRLRSQDYSYTRKRHAYGYNTTRSRKYNAYACSDIAYERKQHRYTILFATSCKQAPLAVVHHTAATASNSLAVLTQFVRVSSVLTVMADVLGAATREHATGVIDDLAVTKVIQLGVRRHTCSYKSTRYQISEPEVRGFMFWKNEPSQPKMTRPSYAAWIKIPSHCV